MSVGWLNRDSARLLASNAVRTFGYGLMSVLLGLYLARAGYSSTQVGLVLTSALAGSAILTALLTARIDRWGRRRTLAVSAALMALAGLALALSQNLALLILAALTGTVSATSSEVGPFEAIEQAILPQVVPAAARTGVFGWYNVAGALAVACGALAAGLPDQLHARLGIDLLGAQRAMFLVYAALGLLTLLILATLSPAVEMARGAGGAPLPAPLHRSRGVVARLSALFALDALGGGFVVQSLVAYWFAQRFGATGAQLGPIFFAVGLLKAVSFLLAVRIAGRIGLINTMVFTHLPSNVLLALIPLMPTFSLAVLCLLARHTLSQMDVPVRQAYVVAVVDPTERTAASGVTSLVRMLAQMVSPALAGVALQFLSVGAPFLLAGGLKIVYDLGLYANFRAVKPPEETG